jgi:hypothetical protein
MQAVPKTPGGLCVFELLPMFAIFTEGHRAEMVE